MLHATDKHTGLTAEMVRALYDYDPDTGVLTYAADSRQKKKGAVAGYLTPMGYRRMKINGRSYAQHRIAWLHFYGEWPKEEIDHINRVKHDNRIDNLREANRTQNCINVHTRSKTSGARGVHFGVEDGLPRYTAYITIRRKTIKLGRHKTLEAARTARRIAEICVETHDRAEHWHVKMMAKIFVDVFGAMPHLFADEPAKQR